MLVINGPRGTGKTSLLLTLLGLWHRRGKARAEEQISDDYHQLLEAGKVLRSLGPFDFDPLPDHLHAYSWILLAFGQLAALLEPRSESSSDSEHYVHSLRDSVFRRWEKLHHDALIAWNQDALRNAMTSDLDEFAFDQRSRDEGWHNLEERWHSFVDELFTALEERGELSVNDILVIAIDDLDLHPTRGAELLLALRLCRHPRVAFVLTGDLTHLEEVLSVHFFRRELGGGDAQSISLPPDEEIGRWLRAKRLAADLIDKVIPRSYRFEMPLMSVADVQERYLEMEHPLMKHLQQAVSDLDEVLVQREVGYRSGFRFRDMEGAREPISELTDYQYAGADLFRLLKTRSGEPVFVRHDTWQLSLERPVICEATRAGAIGQGRTMVTTHLRFVSETELAISDQKQVVRRATDRNVLIASMLGLISAERFIWRTSDYPPLVSTHFRTDHADIELYWKAWSPTQSPLQMVTRARDWFRLSRQKKTRSPSDVAFRWTLLQIQEASRSGIGQAIAAECSGLSDGDWSSLVRILKRWPATEKVGRRYSLIRWILEWLPILAAPEYDLPGDTQHAILDLVRVLSNNNEATYTQLRKTWEQARQDAVRDALGRQEQPSVDSEIVVEWISIFNDSSKTSDWSAARVNKNNWWREPIDGADKYSFSDIAFGNRVFEDLLQTPRNSDLSPQSTWAANQLSRFLEARSTGRVLATLRETYRTYGLKAPAVNIARLWQSIVEQSEEEYGASYADALGWLDSGSTETRLHYSGPELTFEPVLDNTIELASVAIRRWGDWHPRFLNRKMPEELEKALAAILMLAQSVARSLGHSLENVSFITPTLIESITEQKLTLSPLPILSLHGLEILRLGWLSVFDRVQIHVQQRNAKRFALQQWVIAQFLWLTGWASQTQYGSAVAIQYPADTVDFTKMHNALLLSNNFHDWVMKTGIAVHLDNEFRQIVQSRSA